MKVPAVTQTLEVSYLIYSDFETKFTFLAPKLSNSWQQKKGFAKARKIFLRNSAEILDLLPNLCTRIWVGATIHHFKKKTIVNLPIRLKRKSKRISSNSLSPWGAQNKDIGDANRQCRIQTLR